MPKPVIRDEIRATLRLGMPIVLSLMAQQMFGFIDTIMAGHLSSLDLAAVAIGRSLFMPVFIFVLGILIAVSPIVAQYYGARKTGEISRAVWQGLILSQIIALPCMLIIRNIHNLQGLMNITPEIIPISRDYLKAISWCLPAAFAYQTLRFFNEGLSISRPNLIFMLAAIPVNFIGNYLFMYGNLGFPRLGAPGAGWATALVWWCLLAAMLTFTVRMSHHEHFKIFKNITLPSWRYFREILRIGIPNGISFGMEVGMFAVASLIIGSLGVVPMAGHQIAINVASIAFMIPLGISFATTARVGFAVGERSMYRVRMVGHIGNVLAVLVMCCSATLMLLLPRPIISLYTSDTEVIQVGVQLLFLAAIFQISDGLQASAAGALRGLKDTRIPMIVNFIAYWAVGIPVGYWVGIIRGLGARGLWIGMIAGLAVAAAAHTTRFHIFSRLSRLEKIKAV